MKLTYFSVIITIIYGNLLILIFYFLRKKMISIGMCNIGMVLTFYIFCAVRLAIPLEFSWTKSINGGLLFNVLYSFLTHEICSKYCSVNVSQILIFIWLIGAIWNLMHLVYQYLFLFFHYNSLKDYDIYKDENGKLIKIIKTDEISTACLIGVFKHIILLPNRDYTQTQLKYILIHELSHIKNHDMLIKCLINVVGGVYWWNPIIRLLKKDLFQSIEIRCDYRVCSTINKQEYVDYMTVLLYEYKNAIAYETKNSAQPVYFVSTSQAPIEERFLLINDIDVGKWAKCQVLVLIIMLTSLLFSYSIVIQSKFDIPKQDISYVNSFDENNSYILKHNNGTYSLICPFEEYTIDNTEAIFYLNNNFELRIEEQNEK